MDYEFLLYLALILLSTKLLGLLCKKINLPEVVGALVAGIILGPSLLDVVNFEGPSGSFLEYAAEVGVILLMFGAGLETDLKENAVASFIVAVIGVVVPLLGGFFSYALFFHSDVSDYMQLLHAIFIGVVLTATSVSITVQTLRELGKLQGRVGTTILGAAIIDDILGIIVLTIVTSLKDTSVQPSTVLIKIVLYAIMIVLLYIILRKLENFFSQRDGKRRIAIYAFAFCFFLSFLSEHVFGIADITGAYFAGLMICMSKVKNYVNFKVETISNVFFASIFFASIGIKVTLGGMSMDLWGFAIILTVVAIITKLIGCGLGARLCKMSMRESIQIGVGMVSRGEVALIVAEKGRQYGLIKTDMFAPIVLVVIVTTIITPILLKIVFAEKKSA